MVNCTNARASSKGVGTGGTKYADFVPFDLAKMSRMMGLLFVNGLSLKADVKLWFKTVMESHLFGNDDVATAMNKNLGNWKKVRCLHRWKHVRRFFAFYKFRLAKDKETTKNPLWKVSHCLMNYEIKS